MYSIADEEDIHLTFCVTLIEYMYMKQFAMNNLNNNIRQIGG